MKIGTLVNEVAAFECDGNEDDDDDGGGETGNKVTTIARELVAQITNEFLFLSFFLVFFNCFADCLILWTSFFGSRFQFFDHFEFGFFI